VSGNFWHSITTAIELVNYTLSTISQSEQSGGTITRFNSCDQHSG